VQAKFNIRGDGDGILFVIDGATSQNRKSSEHKTLFCDFQEFNIHEPKKARTTLLN
jgi:hypothetical protein